MLQFLSLLHLFPHLQKIRLEDVLLEPSVPGTRLQRLPVTSLDVRLDLPVYYDDELCNILKCFSTAQYAALHPSFMCNDRQSSEPPPGVLTTKINTLAVHGGPKGASSLFARLARSPAAKVQTVSIYQLALHHKSTILPAPRGIDAFLSASQATVASLTLSFKVVTRDSGTFLLAWYILIGSSYYATQRAHLPYILANAGLCARSLLSSLMVKTTGVKYGQSSQLCPARRTSPSRTSRC